MTKTTKGSAAAGDDEHVTTPSAPTAGEPDHQVVSVFVVDDHPVLREGLRDVLERTGRIQVVGEAGSVEDAITRLRIVRPQVVMLDLRLTDGTGIELCTHIRSTYADMGVLVLTASSTDDMLFAAIEAGTNGFLLKSSRIDAIADAIHAIAEGGSVIDPALAGRVMRKLREPTITVDDHLQMLSPSEREVLSHLAAGRSNREIAARVCLSESAVKKHVTSLMRKIEVQSRTEAAIFALRVGLDAG